MFVFVGHSSFHVPDQAVGVTVASSTTLETGGALDWQGRVFVVRRPDGVMIRVWRAATGHTANDAILRISFSDDDGVTWTADNTTLSGAAVSGFPISVPLGNIMIGEGLPFYAPNGDLLIHTWAYTGTWAVNAVPKGTYQYRSAGGLGEAWTLDGAVTWAGTTDDLRVFSTEQFRVLDGAVYGGARHYTADNGSTSELWFVKNTTDDCAYTAWEKVANILTESDVTGGGQELGLAYLGDGNWLALCRDNPHTHSYQRRGTGMGTSWGAVEDVTGQVGIWGRNKVYTRAELKGQANWWKDRVLICETFNHQVSGDSMPRRPMVCISRDQGDTWERFFIAAQTTDAGYGDIFYRRATGQYVVETYAGTLTAADQTQHVLSIAGV